MINPLLSEADFFWQTTEIWLNKVEKNIKKVLTGNWRHDIISELLMQMKKNLKNKIKKFLTKQKASDIMNELSAERRRQTTLITKQWNTYDSRKFFTFLRTVWKTKNSKTRDSYLLSWVNQTFNQRVWSWLRMNAGGVLNTCKSNGNYFIETSVDLI